MLKGFWRCIYYWPGPDAPISGAAAINFCAQAADLVMVASLPSTRNGYSFLFSMEEHDGFGIFYPDASRCLQMPPDAMPADTSRCLQMPPDVSRCFQMPPRCLHIHRRLLTE